MSGFGKETWGFLVSIVFGILLTVLIIPDWLRPYLSWLFLLLLICTSIAWLVSTFDKLAKFRASPKAFHPMTLLIVGVVGALVSICAWMLVSPGTKDAPAEIKSPKFALSDDQFTIEIGGNFQQISRASLESGPRVGGGFGLPISFALVDNQLVVDADISGIKVQQNKILVGEVKHDVNHNPDWSVIEIVNASTQPILQLIYKQRTHLELRGIFQKEGKVMICGDTTAIHKVLTNEKIAQTGLKPIFKYPAWKHPGEFVVYPTGPTGFVKSRVHLDNPGNFDADGHYNVFVELKNMGPAFAIAPEMFIAIPTSKPERYLWQVRRSKKTVHIGEPFDTTIPVKMSSPGAIVIFVAVRYVNANTQHLNVDTVLLGGFKWNESKNRFEDYQPLPPQRRDELTAELQPKLRELSESPRQ